MSLRIKSKEDLDNHSRKKTKYVGFDTTTTGEGGGQLVKEICDRWSPCLYLVRLYARMGLHRYNMLQGKNLKLSRVKRYNISTWSAACSYYITLVATDPSTNKRLTFQTLVNEKRFGMFILTSDIARPRGTIPEDGSLRPEHYCYPGNSLPDPLPEDLFENTKKFYQVKESEMEHNDCWIRLYLELAVATTHRTINVGSRYDFSSLKIVKVAIETSEDVVDPLNAVNALVYIRYKDLCEARVDKDVDRIAIVRRSFSELNGCFILEGQNQPIKS